MEDKRRNVDEFMMKMNGDPAFWAPK